MQPGKISFHTEKIKFSLPKKNKIQAWLLKSVERENAVVVSINFIFCSDPFLHAMNKKYLRHDTLTDIITFDYSGNKENIEGDVYISIQRVKENARIFSTGFEHELHRVMMHGVLHLLGYKDKKKSEVALMRKKENYYLERFSDWG